ncbi:MAG TPA: chaperonin GroEL [Roseiflexaceae bacterium]|nr:chaperonin GroEL [Roseiflexaceae bacterium]
MSDHASPRVVFYPRSHQGIQKGVNQLAAVVRPTLGPCPRTVAVESTFRDKAPELLDSAGVITRRIIQLPERDADVGAMLLRHVLWRVHDEVGDGTATAAVLFQTVYNHGLKYIAAGGNAIQLRRYLEAGMQDILDELDRMTVRLEGQEQLTRLAESLCYDPSLAKLLGEMFDIVGEYGQVDIRIGYGRQLERQYVEGMYWSSGVLSPRMFTDQVKLRADLTNAALLISDLEIDDPRQFMPVIDTIMERQIQTFVIVAEKLSDNVITFLLSASRDPERLQIVATRTPGSGAIEQMVAMEDLAILTGGRPLIKAAGNTLRQFKIAHLGHARRVWADGSYLGIIGGKGDPRMLRRQIASLRAAYKTASEPQQRASLQQRIGKFMGGSATLLVGGSTDSETNVREEQARKTSTLLRAALHEGVLPGGGLALLACRNRLRQRLETSACLDEQTAYRILIRALEEPLRTIATNAGHDAAAVMAQVSQAAPGWGLDARSGEIVDMAESGIYDVAAAQKAAIRGAVSGAATALTVDTVIHKRNPEAVTGRP